MIDLHDDRIISISAISGTDLYSTISPELDRWDNNRINQREQPNTEDWICICWSLNRNCS